MVRLDGTRLYDVRIDGSLCEETDAFLFTGLFLEHTYKLGTDNLALLLRVGDTCQFVEEPIGGINIHQISIQLIAEDTYHLFGFAFAQQAVIHMNRHQLLANGLDEEGCHHR